MNNGAIAIIITVVIANAIPEYFAFPEPINAFPNRQEKANPNCPIIASIISN
ncbi:hypothetical protein ES706_05836 [subsurface metagenome]